MRLTWYGHSVFRLDLDGASILFDPFLSGSPTFEGDWQAPAEGVTHILVTHGHADHVGDTIAIAKATGAMVVGVFEICMWAQQQGVEKINPGYHGGGIDCGAFRVNFVGAMHGAGYSTDDTDFLYMGSPVGFVVTPKDGKPVYHMGDTGVFGDMALINELYAPKVGLVPIGDRFTMGAREAAYACTRLLDFETIVPCHYGTFSIIDQTPDHFIEAMGEGAAKVRVPAIGEAIEL